MKQKIKRKFDEIKLRLLEFAEIQGIPKYQFYKKISIPQSNFGGKSMESSLSSAKISEILIIFPEINPDWLLLGKGEMLRQHQTSIPIDTNMTTLIEKISELSQQIGQLKAENEFLKKENAHLENVVKGVTATDVSA